MSTGKWDVYVQLTNGRMVDSKSWRKVGSFKTAEKARQRAKADVDKRNAVKKSTDARWYWEGIVLGGGREEHVY